MSLDIWLAYLVTVLVLMSTPGPSHLLMLSNSISHGFTRSLATAAGDLTANLLQMLAAGLGLVAVVLASERAFAVIKWLGVVYLLWLGTGMIRRSFQKSADDSPVPQAGMRRLWVQGFITSASNPKAVVFFAALFPLFIDPGEAFWAQFAALSMTYLAVDAGFLCAYGAGAGWLSRRLQKSGRLWLDRLGGSLIIAAAVALGTRNLTAVR